MKKPRTIMLIDMQSFYASCEKVKYPQYKNSPLVVAGDPDRRSGIVLAACPIAKQYGVSTADRLWEALNKCPNLVVIKPNMQYYIDQSIQITKIVESFTDLVEQYSIDELFGDFTNSMHLFADNPIDLAKQIQMKIKETTGIYARCGISHNKIMAKVCCDIVAKKIDGGVFYLDKQGLEERVWPKPVEDLWGIGSKMRRHLNGMGVFTIGGLAKLPLTLLTKRWGVNGHVIWQCSQGIDDSPVTPNTFDNTQKGIGNGMVLPRDYADAYDIEVVLRELCSQVCRRARTSNLMGQVVSVSCSGADWDFPTGFHRQMKLNTATNLSMEMFAAVKKIFHQHWDKQPVRRLGVDLSQLKDDSVYQMDLFDDRDKLIKTEKVLDGIKNRFGETAILRASSLTNAGQARDRAAKIGGHYK